MEAVEEVMPKAELMQLEACNRGNDKLIAPTSQFVIPAEGTYSGLGTAMLVKSKRCKVRRQQSSSWDKFLGRNSISGETMNKTNIPKVLKTWFHESCQH